MGKGATMTQSAAYKSVAETIGMRTKDVKGAVAAMMDVAAKELKKSGSFKLAGRLNLKLKKKDATPARKGVNPFTKEPCVFKAKPASKTVRALPMKKLKTMVNWGCAPGDCTENSFEFVRSRWAVSPVLGD